MLLKLSALLVASSQASVVRVRKQERAVRKVWESLQLTVRFNELITKTCSNVSSMVSVSMCLIPPVSAHARPVNNKTSDSGGQYLKPLRDAGMERKLR